MASLLTLHVTIVIAPSDIPEFTKAISVLFDHVIAEPECKFVEILHKPEEPGVFRFVEIWNATRAWLYEVSGELAKGMCFMTIITEHLQVQIMKPYYEPYMAATKHMWLKPRKLQLLHLPEMREKRLQN